MATAANYPIESVDNAVRILLMLRHRRSLRAARVADELGVARSTAYRMLTTLQARDMLRQDAVSKEFGPGPALVELGIAVIGAADLKAEARPTLERLAERTGETVHLCALEGAHTLFLDGVEGGHVIRAGLRIGQRLPAHSTSAGKVLLAALDPAEILQRFPKAKLTGGTERALKTRRALEVELDEVRQRGIALNLSESESDLNAVSVAIRDSRGVARGALTISGPAYRLPVERISELTADLLSGEREIAARLG
ncbi:IclR family transcriptional regulator [Nocardia amikacinitolerans]|uniref:IclR family transcriptional regulator n=1 Tax=Nocardia amikacinitolerans TaxID=756689 RepID=UPI0020A2D026|nr:IclR family transcriptional regulator [Nocardia amikacinitolerans]MCP2281012.1 transcriptional regulator, IclR family [Nocardia amikacinitolerans]MCP2300035.1 transcriptional regulator, IclR family [Nocardia amikacinitolerans]